MATSGTVNISQAVSSLARLIADQGGSSKDINVQRALHDTAWRLLLDLDQQVMQQQKINYAPSRSQLCTHVICVLGRRHLMIHHGRVPTELQQLRWAVLDRIQRCQLVIKCKQMLGWESQAHFAAIVLLLWLGIAAGDA
jgi:hypothetical protein